MFKKLYLIPSFLLLTFYSNCQEIINYNDNGIKLKIPVLDGFQKIPKSVSDQMKTNGTYNIATFSLGDNFESNHVSLYGINGSTQYTFKQTDILDFLNKGKLKFSNLNESFTSVKVKPYWARIKNILSDYYRNDSLKTNEFNVSIDLMSKGDITNYIKAEKPTLLIENQFGFINLLNIKYMLPNIKIYSCTLSSFIFLNNHIVGMSANIESLDKNEFDKLVLLNENFFLQLELLNLSK